MYFFKISQLESNRRNGFKKSIKKQVIRNRK